MIRDFTLGSGLAGGLMIGAATALLLWTNGRIAGVSGILASSWLQRDGSGPWRWAFLLGLPAGAALCALLFGMPTVRLQAGWITSIVAGLLVGIGTRLGGGCTSGHGVCGLARLSRRSLVAVVVFMATGALVASAVYGRNLLR